VIYFSKLVKVPGLLFSKNLAILYLYKMVTKISGPSDIHPSNPFESNYIATIFFLNAECRNLWQCLFSIWNFRLKQSKTTSIIIYAQQLVIFQLEFQSISRSCWMAWKLNFHKQIHHLVISFRFFFFYITIKFFCLSHLRYMLKIS
jgi:hypothetical protein